MQGINAGHACACLSRETFAFVGMIHVMASAHELKIDADLAKAFTAVLGYDPQIAEPVVVLAAYVHSLKDGYGLSEHYELDEGHFTHIDPPAPARELIAEYFDVAAAQFNRDAIANCLYRAFDTLAQNLDARHLLNKNQPLSEDGLLKIAQIAWNLEQNEAARPRLAIASGQPMALGGGTIAHIKVPDQNKDFAEMKWTARSNTGATGLGKGQAARSSGQGFRTKTALLSVLAARHLVTVHPDPSETFELASLATDGGKRVIAWPAAEVIVDSRPVLVAPPDNADQSTVEPTGAPRARVLVGDFVEVGDRYQPRELDAQVQRLWQDGGDRRIWIGGGPGFGKSYAARKVMQDALRNQSENRDDVLIWVDSADPVSVARELARVAGRMPGMKPAALVGETASEADVARELLRHLATSDVRWLIVFDNADADALITQRWIPPGTNPNGRVLITTTSKSSLIAGQGRHVVAELFTSKEAAEFLTTRLPHAQEDERVSLATKLGRYPLALSIAASTIVANSLDIEDWIVDFDSLTIDVAADNPDSGGYPELISATWRIALQKASEGLPDGVVERAAIVAALQDPDGHPTWLWETETVTRWVAGGTALDRRHGKPVVLQRLDDYRIVELQGDSWKNGRLAIHQLAARAVCELVSVEVLAEIAAILADEWLLKLSENTSVMGMSGIRRGVQPLVALANLPTASRETIAALLGLTDPPSRLFVSSLKEAVDVFTPYLMRGGAIGLEGLAVRLADIGAAEEQLAQLDEAREQYTHAAGIYREVLADPSVGGHLRARCLQHLGVLEGKLDQPDQSRINLTQAAAIYEQLTTIESPGNLLGAQLESLANIYDELGNRDKARITRERWAESVSKQPEDAPVAVAPEEMHETAQSWRTRGSHLRALRQPNEAKNWLARAAEMFRACDVPFFAAAVVREIAELHVETNDWDQAERSLASLTTDRYSMTADFVLLASLQKRLGRSDDAEKTLSQAAKKYPTLEDRRSITRGPMDNAKHREFLADVAESWLMVGRVELGQLRFDAISCQRWSDAAGLAEGILDLAQGRADAGPGDHEGELALAHLWLGQSYISSGQVEQAVVHSKFAVDIFQVLMDLDESNTVITISLMEARLYHGLAHYTCGRPKDAADHLIRVVDTLDQLAKITPGYRAEQLGGVLLFLGDAYEELGLVDESVDCYTRRVTARGTVASMSPSNGEAQNELADAWRFLGLALARFDRAEEAIEPLLQNLELCRALADDQNPRDGKTARRAADAQVLLGTVYIKLDRHAEALKLLSQAVSELQDLANQDLDDVETQENHANARNVYGIALFQSEHLEDAAEQLKLSVNVYEMLLGLNSGNQESRLIPLLATFAEVLRQLDRPDEATAADARAAELTRQMDGPSTTKEA